MNTKPTGMQPEPSAFNVKETVAYFRRKWLREHAVELACQLAAALVALYFAAAAGGLWLGAAIIGAIVWYGWMRNRMMIYVEKHAFPLPGEDSYHTEEYTDGGSGK